MRRWMANAALIAYAVTATAVVVVLYTHRPTSNTTYPDDGVREAGAARSALAARLADRVARTTDAPASMSHTPTVVDTKPTDVALTWEVTDETPAAHVLRQQAHSIKASSSECVAAAAELRNMPWNELSYDDILLLADAVDRAANSRLGRTAIRYGLSERQQDRAFRIFAVASRAYHPVFDPPSEPGGALPETTPPPPVEASDQTTVDERIYDILDVEQQQDYEDEWVERDLWWTEIITQLDEDVDEELATVVATPDETEGEEPEEHLGGNVFDLLGQ